MILKKMLNAFCGGERFALCKLSLSLLLTLCGVACGAAATPADESWKNMMPWPRHFERVEGAYRTKGEPIVADETRDVKLERQLQNLRFRLGGPRSVAAADGTEPVPPEVLQLPLEKEGYRLTVDGEGIHVAAADDTGAFYARMTLRQLAAKTADGYEMPFCKIEDAPVYPYRGVLVDEGRHFFGKAAIMKTLDLMSRYKLNHFHWHLTEDQGWRIEIKSHPELVQFGARRPSSPKRRTTNVPDGKPYGPYFYTQDEIREVVAYAKARHIVIYPEIDMPGHMRSLLASHPELLCEGHRLDAPTPWTEWGITDLTTTAGSGRGRSRLGKSIRSHPHASRRRPTGSWSSAARRTSGANTRSTCPTSNGSSGRVFWPFRRRSGASPIWTIPSSISSAARASTANVSSVRESTPPPSRSTGFLIL